MPLTRTAARSYPRALLGMGIAVIDDEESPPWISLGQT